MFYYDGNQSQNRALALYHMNHICHKCLRNRRLNRSTVYGQKMEPEDVLSDARWYWYSLTEQPRLLIQEFVRGLRDHTITCDLCHFEGFLRSAWMLKALAKLSQPGTLNSPNMSEIL